LIEPKKNNTTRTFSLIFSNIKNMAHPTKKSRIYIFNFFGLLLNEYLLKYLIFKEKASFFLIGGSIFVFAFQNIFTKSQKLLNPCLHKFLCKIGPEIREVRKNFLNGKK
jgi:hypothetical protein